MNRFGSAAVRFGIAFCCVTTLALVVFVTTLWVKGDLEAERINAAVRALRGERPVVVEAPKRATGTQPGDSAEMRSLLAMAEARDRDLKLQLEQIKSQRKAAESRKSEVGSQKTDSTGTPTAPETKPAPAATDKFTTNLNVLRNHPPKTAADMMADWDKTEIATYLRAMKPYEAADILAAMLAMGKKGSIDYATKAREVQAELGR